MSLTRTNKFPSFQAPSSRAGAGLAALDPGAHRDYSLRIAPHRAIGISTPEARASKALTPNGAFFMRGPFLAEPCGQPRGWPDSCPVVLTRTVPASITGLAPSGGDC